MQSILYILMSDYDVAMMSIMLVFFIFAIMGLIVLFASIYKVIKSTIKYKVIYENIPKEIVDDENNNLFDSNLLFFFDFNDRIINNSIKILFVNMLFNMIIAATSMLFIKTWGPERESYILITITLEYILVLLFNIYILNKLSKNYNTLELILNESFSFSLIIEDKDLSLIESLYPVKLFPEIEYNNLIDCELTIIRVGGLPVMCIVDPQE